MKEMSPKLSNELKNLFPNLPYRERGIKITLDLLKVTIKILNNATNKTLPQNCRNETAEKTPYGLDKLVKINLPTSQRTANIVSDILAKKKIVKIIHVKNKKTERMIKGTCLVNKWTW
jgi:hypothetical protein